MKRLIITLIFALGFTVSGFSQSEKALEKAEEKTEKLAEWIEAGDESVALSEDQKDKITALYAEMRMEINAAKNKYSDKSEFETERKKISKKYHSKINKDVLSKAQRQAKRKGKKEN